MTKLYLRGHRVPQAFGLIVIAVCGAIVLGTTAIPLPWVDGTYGAVVPFNVVFALLFLSAVVLFYTSDLAVWEEYSPRSWKTQDYAFLGAAYLPLVLLASFGNAGLWQFSALSLACFWTLSLVQPPLHALSATLFLAFAHCLLIVALPAKFLPLFWKPTLWVTLAASAYSLVIFSIARPKLKRANLR